MYLLNSVMSCNGLRVELCAKSEYFCFHFEVPLPLGNKRRIAPRKCPLDIQLRVALARVSYATVCLGSTTMVLFSTSRLMSGELGTSISSAGSILLFRTLLGLRTLVGLITCKDSYTSNQPNSRNQGKLSNSARDGEVTKLSEVRRVCSHKAQSVCKIKIVL